MFIYTLFIYPSFIILYRILQYTGHCNIQDIALYRILQHTGYCSFRPMHYLIIKELFVKDEPSARSDYRQRGRRMNNHQFYRYKLNKAFREHRPPLQRQIITPILPSVSASFFSRLTIYAFIDIGPRRRNATPTSCEVIITCSLHRILCHNN